MNSLNKTFLPTTNSKNRNWYLIDCKEQRLGRLATLVAGFLKGKNTPQYHPSVDTGDYIVLINADLIILNNSSKHYLVSNPGRPGHSLKIRNVANCLPKFTIERAVKRMLPKTETKKVMRRLKIYPNENHAHQAQNPLKVNLNNIYSSVQVNSNSF